MVLKLYNTLTRKKEIFKLYQKLLSPLKEVRFIETDLENTSPWFIDALVEKRDKLIEYLQKNQIGSRPFYPPLHTQNPYNQWGRYKNKHYSISEEISSDKSLISLNLNSFSL